MRAPPGAGRLLAALLLLAAAAPAWSEPVADGFEAATLGPLWTLRFVTPGRLSVQGDLVHSGTGALRIEVREGDVAMVGGDGAPSERTEVQEADGLHPRFGETHEYAFHMFVPADFPITDTRLVTAQWHQRCFCSPVVAQRYRRGILTVTIETPGGRTTIYRHPQPIQGRWIDLRYQIRFGWADGAVAVWLDGAPVADYRGPLGYPAEPPEVDFRFGLYRDRMATPMVIYFDDYRKERLPQ
jgi:hypothetical protein